MYINLLEHHLKRVLFQVHIFLMQFIHQSSQYITCQLFLLDYKLCVMRINLIRLHYESDEEYDDILCFGLDVEEFVTHGSVDDLDAVDLIGTGHGAGSLFVDIIQDEWE